MEDHTSCAVSECNEKPSPKRSVANGMCSAHYAEHRKVTAPRCSVAECEKPMSKRTWCSTHYARWRRHGKVDTTSRSWTPKGTPCALCGGEVPEATGSRKFCSDSCQTASFRYNNNRPTEAKCAACERPFSLARRDGRFQRTDTKWCRDCRRTKSEARRHVRYGVTQKWYAEQAADGCSICGVTDRTFHVDHDHGCCPGARSCGKCVRGLLCSQCNQALGLFGDNTDVLSKAIEYLSK